MSQEKVYPVADIKLSNTHLDREKYEKLYKKSIDFPEEFWAEQAKELLSWEKSWKGVTQGDFKDASNEWFSRSNSYNLGR